MESGEGGDQRPRTRVDDSATLREIVNEARDKAVQDRIDRVEKQMETLTTILLELRDNQRRSNDRQGMEGGDRPESSRRRQSNDLEGIGRRDGRNEPNVEERIRTSLEEREFRLSFRNEENKHRQDVEQNPSQEKKLEGEVRRLAQVIDEMQGHGKTPSWRIMLDGESPLSVEIMNTVIPRDFCFPDIRFSGKKDPLAHVECFNDLTGVQGLTQMQRCKIFPLMLEGRAHEWYKKLPQGSVRSLEQMCTKFVE